MYFDRTYGEKPDGRRGGYGEHGGHGGRMGGDRRIRSEADARSLLNSGKYRLIVADPALRPLLKTDCKWRDLPHKAAAPYQECTPVSLFGSKLDHLLDTCR